MPPMNADNVGKIHFHKKNGMENMLTSHRDVKPFLSA